MPPICAGSPATLLRGTAQRCDNLSQNLLTRCLPGAYLTSFEARVSSQNRAKSLKRWCRLRDSNTRPPHYECDALPAELRRPDPVAKRGGSEGACLAGRGRIAKPHAGARGVMDRE